MNTTTLLMRAAFALVKEDLHSGVVTSPEDAKHVVAEAIGNVDWEYLDGLDDESLCEIAGHDTDHAETATCRICGGNAE